MLDLKKLFEENTKDGVTDYEAIQKSIDNDYVNPIVAKNKPNMEKLTQEAMEKAQEQVITNLGVDGVTNVDGLKAYAKKLGATTDETKEKLLSLEKSNEELKKQIEESQNSLQEASAKVESYVRNEALTKKDVLPKYINAAKTHASSLLGDETDWETAVAKTSEEYPEWFQKKKAGGKTPTGKEEELSEDEENKKMRLLAGLN